MTQVHANVTEEIRWMDDQHKIIRFAKKSDQTRFSLM